VISKADIKHIRSLQRKKFRDQHQEFVIEGRKLLDEAIEHAPEFVKTIYTSEPENIKNVSNLEVVKISNKELDQISSLKSPQPFVTICRKSIENNIESHLILALDDIQDPGNMGTILRLSAWFGIKDVILSEGCVDIYNPKVVQASMGAIFTVNSVVRNLETFMHDNNLPVFGAVLGGKNVYTEKLPQSAILLMGNEGNGINEKLLNQISNPISIPKYGSGESLNVAMATSILLSEFRRSQ
jgi:TrmH family RNA methyltransferase